MLVCNEPRLQKWVEEVNQALPRCLGLLDRQPLSKTYGCFDKDFWHFRTKDFASSAAQMSVLSLARILDLQEQKILSSPWSKKDLLALIQAGFDFTWTLQHTDGSFDEWYPNERGWGGPVGYVLYALCETYLILRKYSETFDSSIYFDRILLSAKFQSGRPESGTLANHYAVSLLALGKAYQVTSEEMVKKAYLNLRNSFLQLCSKEGWSLEYDGFDASYNLATVSFLGRIPEIQADPELRNYCRASLKFISYLVYPDGSFSGAPSSRHTSHNYPYAWAFWSMEVDIASEITNRALKGELFSKTPRIADQDDHYLHYRLWDLLDAIQVVMKNSAPEKAKAILLPWERPSFFRDFPEAGLLASSKNGKYLVLSYKRGGTFVLFDLAQRKRIAVLSNYLLREKSGKLLSPQFIQQQMRITCEQDASEIRFEGKYDCLPVFNQVFSPFKNILFRIFVSCMSCFPSGARFLKGIIRRLMILDRKTAKAYVRRSIYFSNQRFLLRDVLDIPKLDGHMICRSTEIFSRYVPQSRYYSDLEKSEVKSIEKAQTEWVTEVVF